MQNRPLQARSTMLNPAERLPAAERASGDPSDEGHMRSPSQARVRFHFPFGNLRLQPCVQLIHHGKAVLLVKRSRSSGCSPAPRLSLVAVDLAQKIPARTGTPREAGRHLHKVAPCVSIAVPHQDFQLLRQLGGNCVTGRRTSESVRESICSMRQNPAKFSPACRHR